MTEQNAPDASAPASAKPYLLNKCLVSYGIMNGIFNAVICYLMNMGDPAKTYAISQVAFDMALTGVLLGLILMACAVPLTRVDLKKGTINASMADDSLIARVPARLIPSALIVAVVTMCVMAGIGSLLCLVLPMPLGLMGFVALKGCVCAVGGAAAGYLSICYTLRSAVRS